MRKFAFWSSLMVSVALMGGCPMNGDNDNDNDNGNGNGNQNANQNDNDDGGNDNGGNDNSGNDNGNDNSGNDNGNDNGGNDNSGNDNGGNDNSGNDNSGNDNSGNDNSGNDNGGNDNDGTVIPPVSLLPGTYSGTADVVTVQTIGEQVGTPRNSTMNQAVTFNDDGTIRTVFIPGYSSKTDFAAAEISRVGDVKRLIERNSSDLITYRLKAEMLEAVYDVTTADLVIDLEVAINNYNAAGERISRLEGTGTHTVSMELVGNQLDIVTETIYNVNGLEPLTFTSREEVDISGTLER